MGHIIKMDRQLISESIESLTYVTLSKTGPYNQNGPGPPVDIREYTMLQFGSINILSAPCVILLLLLAAFHENVKFLNSIYFGEKYF